ncbi:MAG: hypothetical protein R6V00_11780 [Candidatus Aminicenantes bacterium]
MKKNIYWVLFCMAFLYGLPLFHSRSHPIDLFFPEKSTELNQILENCAQYCEKLSHSSLYFVCREQVEEMIKHPTESASSSFALSGGRTYRVYGGIDTEKHTYVYDYQLVRKEGMIKESRILLKEDGKKKHEENAPLKTKRFFYKHVIFGPTGLLSRKAQLNHNFKIIKRKKFNKEPVIVIRTTPKNEREANHLYGDVWVSEDDYRILKIEWNQKSLGNYKRIENIAEKSNATPKPVLISEYMYEHNGIQFPSKYVIKEIYESKFKRRRTLKSEVKVTYEDYKFFTVSTEIK